MRFWIGFIKWLKIFFYIILGCVDEKLNVEFGIYGIGVYFDYGLIIFFVMDDVFGF